MEEEMEIEVFEAYEIDLDYEFDAARCFDFTRPESLAEARGAELWFESAESYPPSPFVAKMVPKEDIFMENVNTNMKSEAVEDTDNVYDDVGAGSESLGTDVNNIDCDGRSGGIFTNLWSGKLQKIYDQVQSFTTGLKYDMTSNKLNTGSKPDVKQFFPRSSTLTVKQNNFHECGMSRFQMPSVQTNRKGSCNSFGLESQAAKRQKLDGGHLRKVADVKQQTNMVHKVPKKDGHLDGNSALPRLKLTIPREPDLQTAHRAQRARLNNSTEVEQVRSAARRFKARPLNRKILEAPSLPLPKRSTPRLPEFQVFHLKTSERAMLHATAVSSSSLHCSDSEKGFDKASTVAENINRRPSATMPMGVPKQDAQEMACNFKAHPRHKILSKGDNGVFRNIKRETTAPMELNFHTKKRIQHNPPIDLFSKLSLTPGLPPSNGSQLKFHRSASIKMTHLVNEKCSVWG